VGDRASHHAVHVLVSGRVQGVGFRWFVMREARTLGVTGWVRNRMEGDVEIHAEGDSGLLERFLRVVAEGPPYGRVERVERIDAEARGSFRGFDIVP